MLSNITTRVEKFLTAEGWRRRSSHVNVRDTGIGIPKEDQERIFERFYRVDKSHSKEIGGTGLGLSIVKHGVKTLNGRLWLNSEPGQGTEIIMEFPKHHMEKEAAESEKCCFFLYQAGEPASSLTDRMAYAILSNNNPKYKTGKRISSPLSVL